MYMQKLFLLLVLFLSACSADIYKLGPEWKPLKQIVERDLPFVADNATTTIGTNVYTVNLEKWLTRHPPGSAAFKALLSHEQVHAARQEKHGLASWLFAYLTDKDFKWEEEKLGWEQEIRISRRNGIEKRDEIYAAILANDYQGMVSYNEALEWVRSIR